MSTSNGKNTVIEMANAIVEGYKKVVKAKVYVLGYQYNKDQGEIFLKDMERMMRELEEAGYEVYSDKEVVERLGIGKWGIQELEKCKEKAYKMGIKEVMSEVDYVVTALEPITKEEEAEIGFIMYEEYYYTNRESSKIEGLVLGELKKPLVTNRYLLHGEEYDIEDSHNQVYKGMVSPLLVLGVEFDGKGKVSKVRYKDLVDESKGAVKSVYSVNEGEYIIYYKPIVSYGSLCKHFSLGMDELEGSYKGYGQRIYIDERYVKKDIEKVKAELGVYKKYEELSKVYIVA